MLAGMNHAKDVCLWMKIMLNIVAHAEKSHLIWLVVLVYLIWNQINNHSLSNTYFLKNKLDPYGKVFLFNQNNKYLAGVDNKNRIKLWNRTSFTSSQSINLKIKDPIISIALLTNDLLAIGKCVNIKIEIWNISNQSSILSLNDHENCVNTLLSINILNKTNIQYIINLLISIILLLRLFNNVFIIIYHFNIT